MQNIKRIDFFDLSKEEQEAIINKDLANQKLDKNLDQIKSPYDTTFYIVGDKHPGIYWENVKLVDIPEFKYSLTSQELNETYVTRLLNGEKLTKEDFSDFIKHHLEWDVFVK